MEKTPRQRKAETLKRLQSGKLSEAEFKDLARQHDPNYIDWEGFEDWVKATYSAEAEMVLGDVGCKERDVTKVGEEAGWRLCLFVLSPEELFELWKQSTWDSGTDTPINIATRA